MNTARQTGGSIGIALIGAIMAHEIGGRLTPEAFVHGLSVSLVVAAWITLGGAVAAAVLVRSHVAPPERGRGRGRVRAIGGRIRRLRGVAGQGETPATPALVAAGVLLVVIPVVALIMSGAIVGEHLAAREAGGQNVHAADASSDGAARSHGAHVRRASGHEARQRERDGAGRRPG